MNENREELEKIVQEKQPEPKAEEQVIEEEIVEENNTVQEAEPKPIETAKKSKLLEAKELIENSKELVSKAETEVAECKIEVSAAAEAFDEAKRNFNNTTFKSCETLLEKLGFDYSSYDEVEPFELSLDEDDGENFSVQDISSGRFTGLILALFVALATLGVWIYISLTKLKVDPKTLTPETATEQINPILNWIGTLGGNTGGNIMIGAIILGFSALIMAWLVYAIRVNMKGKKNLRIAKEMHEKSKEYCMTKEDCKREMKKVDAHLREATEEVSNFETILNEKVATLKRILHIEGAFDEEKEYHPSSKKSMRETEKVMQGIENLLNTAVTKKGKLNFQSVQALSNAKAIYADYLARIYD